MKKEKIAQNEQNLHTHTIKKIINIAQQQQQQQQKQQQQQQQQHHHHNNDTNNNDDKQNQPLPTYLFTGGPAEFVPTT
jgi:hypothetical protein